MEFISFKLAAVKPEAEEHSDGSSRSGQLRIPLSNCGHVHKPRRGYMAVLNFILERVRAE